LRLTRPFKAFVGHRTIFGGRFHEMRTSKMRLPHVGQAGRIKTPGGLPAIVAILTPTNKQKQTEHDHVSLD
jgi:hypothetical protein